MQTYLKLKSTSSTKQSKKQCSTLKLNLRPKNQPAKKERRILETTKILANTFSKTLAKTLRNVFLNPSISTKTTPK